MQQQQTHKTKIKSLILSRMQRGLHCFFFSFSPLVLFQYLSPLALSSPVAIAVATLSFENTAYFHKLSPEVDLSC